MFLLAEYISKQQMMICWRWTNPPPSGVPHIWILLNICLLTELLVLTGPGNSKLWWQLRCACGQVLIVFFNLFFLSVLSLFYYLRGCHVLLIPKGGSNSSTSCLTTIKDEQQQASNYQGSANEVLWSLTLLPWWLCGWRSLHTAMLKQALVSREKNRVFIWYWRGHLNTEPVFVPLCDALTSSECRITQCQNYREILSYWETESLFFLHSSRFLQFIVQKWTVLTHEYICRSINRNINHIYILLSCFKFSVIQRYFSFWW